MDRTQRITASGERVGEGFRVRCAGIELGPPQASQTVASQNVRFEGDKEEKRKSRRRLADSIVPVDMRCCGVVEGYLAHREEATPSDPTSGL